MTAPACRPSWKKKRWRLALALWLAIPLLYPLSVGPVQYGAIRGWVPAGVYSAYSSPPIRCLDNRIGHAIGYWDWLYGWAQLGADHAMPD